MEISKAMDPVLSNAGQRTNTSTVSNQHMAEIKSQNQGSEETQKQSLSEQMADIVKKLNEQMDSLDTNVRFGFNDKIGSMYISVTERNTGKEIRQIPTEEAMRLAEYFRDAIGMIFDKES